MVVRVGIPPGIPAALQSIRRLASIGFELPLVRVIVIDACDVVPTMFVQMTVITFGPTVRARLKIDHVVVPVVAPLPPRLSDHVQPVIVRSLADVPLTVMVEAVPAL